MLGDSKVQNNTGIAAPVLPQGNGFKYLLRPLPIQFYTCIVAVCLGFCNKLPLVRPHMPVGFTTKTRTGIMNLVFTCTAPFVNLFKIFHGLFLLLRPAVPSCFLDQISSKIPVKILYGIQSSFAAFRDFTLVLTIVTDAIL